MQRTYSSIDKNRAELAWVSERLLSVPVNKVVNTDCTATEKMHALDVRIGTERVIELRRA